MNCRKSLGLLMVLIAVFGVILTSCDEPVSEEFLEGKWYTLEALKSAEPRVSFEFVKGKKLTVGGDTFKWEQLAMGNKFSFKTIAEAPRGEATIVPDYTKGELAVSNSNAPIKNGKYYQISYNVSGLTDNTVPIPWASPSEGTYFSTQNVTLGCSESGASVYYTTTGGTPTASSTQFTAGTSINISTTTTIKAVAIKGGVSSEVLTQTYTIQTAGTAGSVTINADSGTGSLRDAITNAQNGATITISSPQTISLKSCIYIKQNITIVGGENVIITRDPTWPTNTSGSFFEVAQGKTVTFKGIHFKDAVETNTSFGLGGAIYNIGTLTVESCIFNNNKANTGGAIYSTSASISTTVRGCTFYKNSAVGSVAGYGGAIFVGGGSLFMRANLFYQNTASLYGPTVDHSDATGAKVYTRGYNVVEIADGTGKTQSGWMFDTTDGKLGAGSLTSVTNPFVDTTAFKPASGLTSFIPSGTTDLPNYSDDTTRTAPCAPGAVKP